MTWSNWWNEIIRNSLSYVWYTDGMGGRSGASPLSSNYKYLRFIITSYEASYKCLWIDQVSDPSFTYLLRSCQPHLWPALQQEARIFPRGGLLLTMRTKCLQTTPPPLEEQSSERPLVVPRLSMRELSSSTWGIPQWLERLRPTFQQSKVNSCLFLWMIGIEKHNLQASLVGLRRRRLIRLMRKKNPLVIIWRTMMINFQWISNTSNLLAVQSVDKYHFRDLNFNIHFTFPLFVCSRWWASSKVE